MSAVRMIRRRELQQPPATEDEYLAMTRRELKAVKRMTRDFEEGLEYYRLRHKPLRHMLLGLVNGMARGVGFAIGITILTYLLIRILQALNVLELPLIGDFIAELMEYVDAARSVGIR